MVLGAPLWLTAAASAGNVLALDSSGWQMAGYDARSTFFNPGERVLTHPSVRADRLRHRRSEPQLTQKYRCAARGDGEA